ncbi:MAG TPA: ABC transporter substrate-binding protein [Verrucomicrobiae bacterium]|nr:ABC transporter substrate-binding protein [Verrucomicrobiae bacterium]
MKKSGWLSSIAVALLFAISLFAAPARAQAPAIVTVNVFQGGFNWPCFVGQQKGFFARNGITVTLQPTPNSVAQMTGLAEGKFDIAITAFDNIVAYVEGQGEAPIGPQPEFFAFMGSDNGFLSLVAAPEVKTFADLKGKTLSVDARTTGYAFVLFDILRRNGLQESDYKIEKVGGTTMRWDALREGKQSGTLLSAPFNFLAGEQHFNELARAIQVIGPYQGNVAATRRSWAKENRTKVIAFIRGYAQAIEWLYDKGNRDEAIIILLNDVKMSPELAERTYDELLDPKDGFLRKARVSTEGMRTVLALRSRYADAKKVLVDPLKYYDSSYYDAAMR